ncbi:amidohydrolase, partial [Streptomyces sp. SID11233]|nr:amidohydrolase [Streptomyces sp. SID11233]
GGRPMLALRADIDALPIPDTKVTTAYRSTVPGRAHACGHDVHTTVVLGTGLVLADLLQRGLLPRPVRLVFQPAEEVLPGGAAD